MWRCHIDLSAPNPEALERVVPLIRGYDASVYHVEEYVPDGLRSEGGANPEGSERVHICPPAIDPLSPKNMALSPEDAAFVCDQFGIDPDRPLMCQVSRFDPWKDPMGVIDAYRVVKKELPDVQLALVGTAARRDHGWVLEQDDRIGQISLRDPGRERPLKLECLLVRNCAEANDPELAH